MGFVLSLFSSRVTWVFLAIAAVAIALGAQRIQITHLKSVIVGRDAAIAAARAEIASTKALVGQWQDAYKNLTATVIAQNAAITKLETEVAKRMARAKEAIKQADVARLKANGLAETIQQMEIAKDECTGMRQLLDAYSGRVR